MKYLSTTLMPNGLLGMDHRAIVWCHSVLEQVRKVIWVLTKDPASEVDQRSERVTEILGMSLYEKDLAKLSSSLTVRCSTVMLVVLHDSNNSQRFSFYRLSTEY
jgi:hypothetical protein